LHVSTRKLNKDQSFFSRVIKTQQKCSNTRTQQAKLKFWNYSLIIGNIKLVTTQTQTLIIYSISPQKWDNGQMLAHTIPVFTKMHYLISFCLKGNYLYMYTLNTEASPWIIVLLKTSKWMDNCIINTISWEFLSTKRLQWYTFLKLIYMYNYQQVKGC